MENKTHYRKVFKSDHLSSADLEQMIEEGKSLIFTVTHVNAEFDTKVAGKKINANIAYFKEPIKPLVLNAENSNILRNLSGGTPWVDDWKNISVELYVKSNIRFGKELVDGVRIKEQAPKIFTPEEINEIKSKIEKCEDLDSLSQLYNSDIKIKTNKVLVDLVREQNRKLSTK